jgi:predicted small integral membrane protein
MKGKVLGDSCLVTVLGFIESVGEVDVVDYGSNIVLVEHVIDVKVVVGENVISQFCRCGTVAKKL